MAEMPKKRGSTVATNDLSRHFLATLAQWTGGLSPQAFGGAWLNVLTRLAVAPGRQAELARSALQKTLALAQFSGAALQGEAPRAAGTPYANRFADPAWSKFPFNVLAESFISVSDWAREAVRNVPGAEAAAENIVGFTVREGLELVAPDNYLPTNPQLIRQTIDENGRNLLRGVKHLAEDVTRTFKGLGPIGVEHYQVGEQVAATPASDPAHAADGADPVFAADRDGLRRAGADRAGVDHEVLHPRPVAEELTGQLPDRARPHGLHGVVEEPDRRGPQRHDGRLP
ncbi:PHB polymerase, partial [sediment metagenome]